MRKGEKFERINISANDYSKLVKAEKKVKSAKILKRIQAFKLIHLDWKYRKIAKFLSITSDTITDWIRIYNAQGIDGLLTLRYRGRIPLLSQEQLKELRKKKSGFKIAKQAKKYIEEKFGIIYNSNYVQELLKKKFTYPLRKPN